MEAKAQGLGGTARTCGCWGERYHGVRPFYRYSFGYFPLSICLPTIC